MPVGTNGEVDCLVVGGGHSGLEAAARLQALGLSTIIVEKNSRVGDNVRGLFWPHGFPSHVN